MSVELCPCNDVDAAMVEHEVGACNGGAAAAELAIETDRRGNAFHQRGGTAIDDARVAIIGPHPIGRVGGAAGFKADGVGSGLILRLPVEGIVVAAMAEVEKTSGGGKKVEGRLGIAACALEDAAAMLGPFFRLFEVEQEGEPEGEVIVAQAAGTLLEIGFEMKDGVAELGVAGAGNLAELLGNGVPLAQHQAGEEWFGEAAGRAGTGRRESGGRA